MRVTLGTAFLVAVDIRKGSPTLGKWVGVTASAENHRQVWAPAGFARGFCVLSEHAEIQYKCTGLYNNKGESGISWNDPAIGIEWPVENPILSDKDRKAQTLEQWLATSNSDNFTILVGRRASGEKYETTGSRRRGIRGFGADSEITRSRISRGRGGSVLVWQSFAANRSAC